jgi:hypothetical protein
MAFEFKKLSRVASSAGFTQYMYVSADNKAVADSSGYFNAASGFLNIGDVIMAKLGEATGHMVVSANSAAGVVDVNDMNAFATTDTD